MLNQIARIERLTGEWNRFADSAEDASPNPAVSSSVRAALLLDGGEIDRERTAVQNVDRVINIGNKNISSFVYEIHAALIDRNLAESRPALRTGAGSFSPFAARPNDVIFAAVPGFLVGKRFEETNHWLESEWKSGVFHPLIVVGAYHLLFLQISPFPSLNHATALLSTWLLSVRANYPIFETADIVTLLASRQQSYFNALRQAEKSAGGNWSTLNIWIEFYLETLVLATEEVIARVRREVDVYHLTPVQQQILAVVREHGAATRDVIARASGVNVSTIKYHLTILANRGHLQRRGGGRSTSYSIG